MSRRDPPGRPADPRAAGPGGDASAQANAKLVLVTPDERLAGRLGARLEAERFEVETVPTAAAAVRISTERPPALFITTADLPDVSGLELADMLKQQVPAGHVPPGVIVVADAADSRQLVRALREGADDYVASVSGELEVLAARVHAVLRRRGGKPPARLARDTEQAITVGAITIQPWSFRVAVHGEKVDLTLTQFRLLLMLAEQPGLLVRPDEIQRQLAERGSQLRQSSVKSHVYFLRRKLGAAGDQIENVRRVGYRLREG